MHSLVKAFIAAGARLSSTGTFSGSITTYTDQIHTCYAQFQPANTWTKICRCRLICADPPGRGRAERQWGWGNPSWILCCGRDLHCGPANRHVNASLVGFVARTARLGLSATPTATFTRDRRCRRFRQRMHAAYSTWQVRKPRASGRFRQRHFPATRSVRIILWPGTCGAANGRKSLNCNASATMRAALDNLAIFGGGKYTNASGTFPQAAARDQFQHFAASDGDWRCCLPEPYLASAELDDDLHSRNDL